MEKSEPIKDEKLVTVLEHAIHKHDGPTDRQDLKHRVGIYKDLLKKLRDTSLSSNLSDADYCAPYGAGADLLGEDNSYGLVMNAMKPPCYGNGEIDLRYIDIGLKGDNKTECSVCQLGSNSETDVLVTLPCMPIFHEACIVEWLGSNLGATNWNCPSCRALVLEDMSTYRVNYEEQLQRRVEEYPLSGSYTKCMIWIMERNRNDELPIDGM
jgi:hypothetical protein